MNAKVILFSELCHVWSKSNQVNGLKFFGESERKANEGIKSMSKTEFVLK